MALILPHHHLDEIPLLLLAELRKGSVKKKHPFRNAVFSTTVDQLPRSRWVVFRELTEEQHFLIFTDARSEKVRELKENANCGLLFYHNRQGVQIRIDGTAVIHMQDEWTEKYWPGVKGSSVKSYSSVHPPGSRIEDRTEGDRYSENPTGGCFSVIELKPSRMEVLQLGRAAQIRAEFIRFEDGWEGSFLVP